MAEGQQICVVAFDQTVNPDRQQILSGVLQGVCAPNSQVTGATVESTVTQLAIFSSDGAGPNSATITAGQTAITDIALSGAPNPNPLLTCGSPAGAPSLASVGIFCSILSQTTPPVPNCRPSSTSESCEGIVQLAVRTAGARQAGTTHWLAFPYGLIAVPVMSLVFLGSLLCKSKSLPVRAIALNMACLSLSCVLLAGCGGNSSNSMATPSGTYTIVVTSSAPGVKFDPGDGSNQFSATTYTFTLNVK